MIGVEEKAVDIIDRVEGVGEEQATLSPLMEEGEGLVPRKRRGRTQKIL